MTRLFVLPLLVAFSMSSTALWAQSAMDEDLLIPDVSSETSAGSISTGVESDMASKFGLRVYLWNGISPTTGNQSGAHYFRPSYQLNDYVGLSVNLNFATTNVGNWWNQQASLLEPYARVAVGDLWTLGNFAHAGELRVYLPYREGGFGASDQVLRWRLINQLATEVDGLTGPVTLGVYNDTSLRNHRQAATNNFFSTALHGLMEAPIVNNLSFYTEHAVGMELNYDGQSDLLGEFATGEQGLSTNAGAYYYNMTMIQARVNENFRLGLGLEELDREDGIPYNWNNGRTNVILHGRADF